MEHLQEKPVPLTPQPGLLAPVGRRSFLQYAGALTAGGALLSACSDVNDSPKPGSISGARVAADNEMVNLGSGDVGILNYAYALEQLEAAFYETALARPYVGITPAELAILTDIRDHEVIHREWFRLVLGGTGASIPELTFDVSSIDFSNRFTVLTTARVLEDIGVSAYNGAGKYLQTPAFLELAGKIVSVEARHTAVLRNLVVPNSDAFAGDDIIDGNGLDAVREPAQVLPLAQPFIRQRISGSNLPTA